MRAALHSCEYDEQKLVFETEITREETLELVVPDVCADVSAVLDTRGQLLLASKKAGDGTVAIAASVDVRAICAAGEGKTECVSGVIAFDLSIPAEGVTESASVLVHCRLKSVEARALNPRRLLLRAEADFCVAAYAPEKLSLCDCAAQDTDSSLHLLQQTYACCPVRFLRDKSFTVADEYTVSAEYGRNLKLLSTGTQLSVLDVKGVGAKLIVKAQADTTAIFENVDDGSLFSTRFSSSFSQIVEVDGGGGDYEDAVYLQLRDAEFTCLPGRENGFAVFAQLYVTAQAIRRENCRRTYVADAYSNACALKLTKAQIRTAGSPEKRELRFDLQEKLPQKTPLAEIGYLAVTTVTAEAEAGAVTVRARLTGAGTDADGSPAAVSLELYSRQEIEGDPGAKLTVLSALAEAPSILGAAGEASVLLGVTVSCLLSESSEITAVVSLEADEKAPAAEPGPSLVVLCSPRETDLWSLAKKYGSTTDAIRAANGGEENFSISRRPLLIPRAQ